METRNAFSSYCLQKGMKIQQEADKAMKEYMAAHPLSVAPTVDRSQLDLYFKKNIYTKGIADYEEFITGLMELIGGKGSEEKPKPQTVKPIYLPADKIFHRLCAICDKPFETRSNNRLTCCIDHRNRLYHMRATSPLTKVKGG